MDTERRRSLDEFYATAYREIVGGLVVVAGSRATAEDAVQEAFVRLIPRWEKVAHYDEPAAWVRRVAFNLLVDKRRAAARAVTRRMTPTPQQYEDQYPSHGILDEARRGDCRAVAPA